MYFITTVCIHDLATVTVGYFSDKEKAIMAVKENRLDMWETVYEYAVIQKIEEGLYPDPTEEIWFEFDNDKKIYCEISEPPAFNGWTIRGIG